MIAYLYFYTILKTASVTVIVYVKYIKCNIYVLVSIYMYIFFFLPWLSKIVFTFNCGYCVCLCHTSVSVSHRYTRVPCISSCLPSLSHPCRLSQSTLTIELPASRIRFSVAIILSWYPCAQPGWRPDRMLSGLTLEMWWRAPAWVAGGRR